MIKFEYTHIKVVFILVNIFKVLGDENRLRIVHLLMQNEFCVCEIEVMLEMTQSNASRHLGKLKSAGIIESSKDAQFIHYRVSEHFKHENPLLFDYLVNEFKKDSAFQKDLKRYKKYRDNNLNCQWITEDKEKVLNLIK